MNADDIIANDAHRDALRPVHRIHAAGRRLSG
jgi:hypothetical protein